jgi:SagB-type dehydrogenase family enzyme
MANGDAARRYHRLTSYEPDREWTVPVDDPLVRQDFQPNDLDRLPPPAKSYPDGLPVTPLPRDLPAVASPATAVLAGTADVATGTLDLPALARLLHLSAGVVRTSERNGRRTLYRAAGSAGARFPLEVYVSARGVPDLVDGVHWYDPVGHALVRVAPAPLGDATTLVVTGVPWRTGWKYAERGYRHIFWDAGTLLAQQQALAASAGLPALLRTAFADADVARLVGADGVHEFPVALLSLASGVPAVGPSGPATAGSIDREPLEFPLVTLTQRAGDGERLGEPWPAGAPLADPGSGSVSLDEVILRRGSTRRMVQGAALPRRALEWSLAAALRGVADVRPDPQFVAVHAVEGTRPGLYRWPDLDHPVRAGDLRAELYRVCVDQGLGGDASYVVLSTADLAGVDDRGYREAQLAAGIVEGRLHLASYALGAGASGMTFLDSELPALLGEPLGGLLFTCVGVPEYTNRPGGRPGDPVRVRPVTPRLDDR